MRTTEAEEEAFKAMGGYIDNTVKPMYTDNIKPDNPKPDNVNHPKHYTSHKSGVECIQVTEHMNFCIGNAIKYLWRAGLKGNSQIEDLEKAIWYINREIERVK